MSDFAEHGALSEGSDDGTMTPEFTTGYRTTQVVRHMLPRNWFICPPWPAGCRPVTTKSPPGKTVPC